MGILGCGEPSVAKPPKDSEVNLNAVAKKLQSDSNASPEARALAGNVLQKMQTDQETRNFQAGK